jgi:hypothetical protein
MPSELSSNTGLMNPNSVMLAAICLICRGVCVRGFLGLELSLRGSLYLIASDFTEPPSRKKEDFEVEIAKRKRPFLARSLGCGG